MLPCSTSTVCSSPSSVRTFGSLRARMPAGCEQLDEHRVMSGSSRSIALRQRLHDEVVAVTIDDERRQQIRLAMHEPIGVGVERQRLRGSAMRVLEPRAHERLVGRRLAARQHPDRNLRSIAEERVADRAMPRTDHLDDVAGGRLDVHDVGAIDPRMPAADPLLAARGDGHGRTYALCLEHGGHYQSTVYGLRSTVWSQRSNKLVATADRRPQTGAGAIVQFIRHGRTDSLLACSARWRRPIPRSPQRSATRRAGRRRGSSSSPRRTSSAAPSSRRPAR